MTRSTDPEMDAALAADAAYLEAMGADPGPTLEDIPMTSSAREAVAHAISDHDDPFINERREEKLAWSDEILAKLREQGFLVVPREPTEKMIQAAWDEAWDDENGYPGDGWAGPRTTYTAMLAAIDGKDK